MPVAIDTDPEFFHGLTFWGTAVNVQIQEFDTGTTVALRDSDGDSILALPADDARRLRDLLNLATTRGYL
jgi:hypothetical protein